MDVVYCPSPVGVLRIAGDAEAIRGIEFPRRGGWGAAEPSPPPAPRPLADAIRQLGEYFARRRRAFDLPLAPEGTEFQRRVWECLRAIPYGETISYGELARRVGRPAAARAVGAANGANPIPIVIPCHRVIGASGALIGFGGGLSVKSALLALEAPQLSLP
ncbi:MAG: methylated-DNA--[protein]-cysteine S-methyltransferase [Terriglobales bacterium]